MKRLLALLLALSLLLSACGEMDGSAEKQPESAPPSQAETAETEEPAETVEPEETEETEEPAETAELDYAAIQIGEGMYDLSSLPQLQELTIVSAKLASPTELLLLCGEIGDTLYSLDLETGALRTICRLELETESGQNWANTELKETDPIVVVDYYNEQTYMLSSEGELLCQMDRSDYWAFCEKACARYGDDGNLYQYDFETEKETLLYALPAEYIYPYLLGYTLDSSGLIFQAMSVVDGEQVTMIIDRVTGEVIASYLGGDLNAVLSGRTFLDSQNSMPEYDTELSETYTLTVRRGSQSCIKEVDLSQLIADREANMQVDWLNGYGEYDFWGVCLLELWTADEIRYILWDYSGEPIQQGEPTQLEHYELPVYDTGEQGERANALSEQYGVQIYVGESVTGAPFPDYTLSACENEEQISAGLDVLEEAFSVYPEGYLAQLGGDGVRKLCFYLTGTMTPIDPSISIENPAGLTCELGGLELIALNVSGGLRAQDVIHELNHVLDHWLWQENALDEDVWNSMNPEGFDYYYAYIDENGDSYEFAGDYTNTSWDAPAYEGKTDTIYFVDPYSTTYPTEDRARLMEYLLMDTEGDVPSLFESVHVQEKLEYYFQCIRAVCDTEGWTEPPVWETRLSEAADTNG